MVPVLGHLLRMKKIYEDSSIELNPFSTMLQQDFKDEAGIYVIVSTYEPSLMISDPELLADIYGPKNKFFDKYFFTRALLFPLIGDSSLLARSTEAYSLKRKSLSACFYKDKLLKMMKIINEVVADRLEYWAS